MKRLSAILMIGFILAAVSVKAQPVLLKSTDFENGIPTDWTVSSTTSVTLQTNGMAASGNNSVRLKPSTNTSTSVSLLSPVITVDANKEVRLEFNHVPMVPSKAAAQIKLVVNGQEIAQLTTNNYDNKYGSGVQNFQGNFSKASYWSYLPDETTVKNSYWKHEVFYLSSKLGSATSFQIKFVLPTGTDVSCAGWYLDDIKVYSTASEGYEVGVPRISIIEHPDMNYYPYCGDAHIVYDLTDVGQGLNTNADSLYVLYHTPGDETDQKINFDLREDGHYHVDIPYAGIDSTVYWKAVINDAMGNRTTYPFIDQYQKFTFVKPYVGSAPIKTGNTSSQPLFFPSSMQKAMHQVRYSVDELKAAGYTAGKIDGMYVEFTSVPGSTPILPNFKVYIGMMDADYQFKNTTSQYSGTMYNVVNEAQFVMPPIGWQYIKFDSTVNFVWDGESDIIMKSCFEGTSTQGETKISCYSVSADQYKTRVFESTGETATAACTSSLNPKDPTRDYKPNVRFKFVNICFFNTDAGVSRDSILSPTNAYDCDGKIVTAAVCKSSEPDSLRVTLVNYGVDTLHKVLVKWMIDGDETTMDSSMFVGTILPIDSNKVDSNKVKYTVTSNFLPPAGIHTLDIWTEMPEEVGIDWNMENDTASFKLIVTEGLMHGDYAVGGTVSGIQESKTFYTLDDAFLMLINSGVDGPCTFKIQQTENDYWGVPGYAGSWKFPSCVPGVSQINNITFESATDSAVNFISRELSSNIFDLSGVKYYTFKNLNFIELAYFTNIVDIVKLNDLSSNIIFDSCIFSNAVKPNVYAYSNRVLQLASADSITVKNCVFDIYAKYYIYSEGLSSLSLTKNILIKDNTFNLTTVNSTSVGNVENVIYSRYVDGLRIENNVFASTLDSSYYAKISGVNYSVLLNSVDNARVEKNVFTLFGSSAVSLSGVNNSVVANNLISVANINTTSGNLYCYGINATSGDSNIIAYNNIYAKGGKEATKRAYGVNLGYQGQIMNNDLLKNNIILNEGFGYAVAVRPSSAQSFDISNNLYYKQISNDNTNLFSYNGSIATDVETWISNTGDTLSYYTENPIFNSWDKLYSTNVLLCEAGTHIDSVSEDMFGAVRPASTEKNPCIGAREFNPPPSNIYVVSTGVTTGTFDGSMTYVACNYDTETVFVDFRNISTDTIPANSLKLNYSVDGVVSAPYTFTEEVLPDTLYHVELPTQYSFKAINGTKTFVLTAFSELDADTVNNNDTASAKIMSLYQIPAMTPVNMDVDYGNPATLDVSSLITNDSVYWFYKQTDETPFFKGKVFTTADNMYVDTVFYFSRKEEIPVLKISEIQYSKVNTKAGITPNLPNYVVSDNAYEIMNAGNGDLDMTGYSFVYYKAAKGDSITAATATYDFPDNYILPANSSIVLVVANSLDVDSTIALPLKSTFKVGNTVKAGFALKNNSGNFVDAVVVNGARFAKSINVPSSVWSKNTASELEVSNTTAGIIRTQATATTDNGWVTADASHVMTVGTYNNDLTVLTDNGCYGAFTPYNINIINVPTYDPGIASVNIEGLTDSALCGLGEVNVTVKITNTGLENLTSIPIVCEVYDGDNTTPTETFTETYSQQIVPMDTAVYVFTQAVDLSATDNHRNITIKVYTSLDTDVIHTNDTVYYHIVSLLTPDVPTTSDVSVPYASVATLSAQSDHIIIWYEDESTNEELARGETYQTPVLYENDTFYVASLIQNSFVNAVGADSAVVGNSGANAYPSPFNTVVKNIKEQYLLKASDLKDYGYDAGNINSMAFKISTITLGNNQSSVRLNNYNIKIGQTQSTELSVWENGLTTVYTEDSIVYNSSVSGWQTFNFETPYYWDGVSNIVIEVCFAALNTNNKIITYTTNTDYNSTISYRDKNNDACAWSGNPTTVYQKMPYMQLDMDVFGCNSERVPVVVNVAEPPSCDLGIKEITNPVGTVMSGIESPVIVSVKNYGTAATSEFTINWKINGEAQTPYTSDITLDADEIVDITLGQFNFESGEVTIEAYIELECDTINSNDSIMSVVSACIGNEESVSEFTIGTSENADYNSINAAIDALKLSGICGPVVYNIESGEYKEQVVLPKIKGTSATNTITFRSENKDVIITFKQDDSEGNSDVVTLFNTENIYFENLVIKGDKNNSSLVNIFNTHDVHFNKISFVDTTTSASILNIVNIEGVNSELYFIGDTFINGSIAMITESLSDEDVSSGLVIDSCVFNDFICGAVAINSFDNINFRFNNLRSHATNIVGDAARFNSIGGQSSIESNTVILTESSKIRNGIVVRQSQCPDLTPLLIANNAVSITGNANVETMGISIDSSNFVNVYYNTVLLIAGSNNNKAKNLSVGKSSSNVIVRNNNLDNRSKGFAYYVEATDNQVTLSNNNNYYTNGARLAYWNANTDNLSALQNANGLDALSDTVDNPFKSDTCLKLVYPTNIVRAAEPLEDVIMDITGYVRPVTPKPTIGAYEYQFDNYDVGVIQILNPDSKTKYIEGDALPVSVIVKNFGNYSVNSVEIVAVLKGHKNGSDVFQTLTETYNGVISSLDTINFIFSTPLSAVLNNPDGDSLYLEVYTNLALDTIHYNDTSSLSIKVVPGYDLACTSIKKQGAGTLRCGMNMRNQEIAVVIKNVGNKMLDIGDIVNVTYVVTGQTGGVLATNTESFTFPYTFTNESGVTQTLQNLQPGASIQYYVFNNTVNLYPTGTNDTTWTISAYVKTAGDNKVDNDTAASVTYISIISPVPPKGKNDTINYATWGSPMASQVDSLAIQWYTDTVGSSSFYSPAKYENSTLYNTIQLYNDTIFYIKVDSKGSIKCPSAFDSVKVIIKPRCAVDLAALTVSEPPSSPKNGYIFMEADTIKVTVTNYGTAPQTNFTVVCSVKPTTPANAEEELISEVCTMTVQPDDTITYTFQTLYDFTQSASYELRAWVDATNDCSKQNDTTGKYKVTALKNMVGDGHQVSNGVSLDITRVQFSTLDNSSNAFSDKYSDYTKSVDPAIVFRGLNDSLVVQIEPSSEFEIKENTIIRGWMKAWIDWDRNGVFDPENELVYSDTVKQGELNKGLIEIPDTAHTGYTRMRIIVSQNDAAHTFGPTPGADTNLAIDLGEIEDYKVFVRPIEQINAELTRFVSPERLNNEQHHDITVRLRNAGQQNLTSANITWIYEEETNVYEWTGNLASSESEYVKLTDMDLAYGNNKFIAYVDATGDTYHDNDTVELETYVFHTYKLTYQTKFDELEVLNDDFFAYEQNIVQPSNCWQFGTPDADSNTNIISAYSQPYCWKTNLKGQYPTDNSSILYSPVFDIQVIKPDTLSFMLRKDMGTGASLVVEYKNYAGSWVKLGVKNDENGEHWYDSDDGFTKTNSSWDKCVYSLNSVSSNLGSTLQLRFVFKSGSSNKVGDGVAIDNFTLKRALRAQDLGVTAIELTPEKLPNYGQYFYPKVTVTNFGTEDVSAFKVCFISEDMNIPQCEDVMTETVPVGGSIDYVFKNGRYLDASMPDPFTVVAYTRLNPTDIYDDNDSTWITCVIGPLQKDVALLDIVEPTAKIASNDDVYVSVRIKNYGLTPIEELPVGYQIEGLAPVNETITFNPPLVNGDEYVYKFKQPYHSVFGTVDLTTWVGLDGDFYHDNDTMYRRLESTNVKRDLEAKYITIDDSQDNDYGIQFAFANHSNIGLDNITVGYYYNGDFENRVQETYRNGGVLPAGATGYHTFKKRISKQIYQSVCAYIILPEADDDPSNDQTCDVYLGFRDAVADSVLVEHNGSEECKVQLRAHNAGSLGGRDTKVKATYVVNGDWSNQHSETFTWEYDEPNGDVMYMTFSQGIPRSEDGKYDVVAWITYPNDINHANDTTHIVKVLSYVNLEETQAEESAFTLEQNVPNPLKDATEISFAISQPGKVDLTITDNSGRVLYRVSDNYSEGRHTVTYDASSLPQGVYYYIAEYNGERKSKKMVVIK